MTVQMQIPDSATLLAETAIHIPRSPSRVYALTDRVGGFWEGQTFIDNEHGGYTISGRPHLRGLSVSNNGSPLSPETAGVFIFHPHQAEHLWADGTRMVITPLLKKHGLIVELSSETADAHWTAEPSFHHANELLSNEDGQSLYKDSESGTFTGISIVGSATICVAFGQTKEETADLLKQLTRDPQAFVAERRNHVAELLQSCYVETNDLLFNKALNWAKLSSNELVVAEFGKGIWAGLSWFHQGWGRDTFISLPGTSLVTGQYEDAAAIVRSFAEFQITDPDHTDYGRVPNRVCSPTEIIYNTTDGTPWLIREIAEYVLMTGDRTFAQEMYPVMQHAIQGAVKNRMDERGYLTHDDADTWMDAKLEGKEPWSPRGNRAVDIQALWYTQLASSAFIAHLLGHSEDAALWGTMADTVKRNFQQDFVADNGTLHDHLNTDNTPDTQIRPNQAFALTVPLFEPLVDSTTEKAVTRQLVEELTYPHGVASLSQNDPAFHPYHHNQIYFFDAAYHNGLCWQWNAGPVIGSMVQTGQQNLAFELTTNLVDQLLHTGMPGSLSELVEPMPAEDGSIILSGTYSQAWSVAEFVRNFYQDYMGIKINMLDRILTINPHLPDALNQVDCICRLGKDEQIELRFSRNGQNNTLIVTANTLHAPLTIRAADLPEQTINSNESLNLSLPQQPQPEETLQFQTPQVNPALKSLTIKDWLQDRITS